MDESEGEVVRDRERKCSIFSTTVLLTFLLVKNIIPNTLDARHDISLNLV